MPSNEIRELTDKVDAIMAHLEIPYEPPGRQAFNPTTPEPERLHAIADLDLVLTDEQADQLLQQAIDDAAQTLAENAAE